MPILSRQNGMKSIANSEGYDLANHITEIVDSANVNAPISSVEERDALVPFEGMTIVRLDLKGVGEVYINGAWVGSGSTAITTFGTGWTPLTGGHVPRLYRAGGNVFLVGGVTQNTGGLVSNILTVQTAFRPSTTGTMFVGHGVTSGGESYELVLSAGVLSIPAGYLTGNFTIGNAVPVTCSWPLY